MKITKVKLKQIIEEELTNVYSEKQTLNEDLATLIDSMSDPEVVGLLAKVTAKIGYELSPAILANFLYWGTRRGLGYDQAVKPRGDEQT